MALPAMPRWPATKIRSAGVIRAGISVGLLLGPESD
jgi:hypothetical protein